MSEKLTKTTNPPIGGIYESNHPKYAGFVIKEEDAGFCYLGGMGDWIVYAMPINQHGDSYYINEDAQRFMMGRDLGDFIPDEIEVRDECCQAFMASQTP